MTADFDELLADPELDAVVIATPVPTHYELARRALEAGQARARREAAGDEGRRRWTSSCALADERDLVLMPGHLLLYHPGVRKLKELVDAGELGEVLCVYTNRQNLGIVRTNENALWSLGVHDLSVILWLIGEDPSEAVALRPRLPHRRASRTSSSATSASPPGRSRTCTSPGSTRTRCGR